MSRTRLTHKLSSKKNKHQHKLGGGGEVETQNIFEISGIEQQKYNMRKKNPLRKRASKVDRDNARQVTQDEEVKKITKATVL